MSIEHTNEWASLRAARTAFEAIPAVQPADLSALSDSGLADLARQREIEFQDALGEIEKRRTNRNHSRWSEQSAAAALALKRADSSYHPQPGAGWPTDLPPPLFRIGYEWATLSIIARLELLLEKPSPDIMLISNFVPAGKSGLYKIEGKPKPMDARRRAAVDLLNDIHRCFARTSGMLRVLPPKRSAFKADDETADGE